MWKADSRPSDAHMVSAVMAWWETPELSHCAQCGCETLGIFFQKRNMVRKLKINSMNTSNSGPHHIHISHLGLFFFLV